MDSYTRESTQPSPVSAVSVRLSLAFPPVWRYCGDLGKQVRSVSMGHAMESLSEPGDASSGRELYNRDCALGELQLVTAADNGAPGPQVPSGGA